MNFKSWLMSYVCSESFYIYYLYSWSYSYTSFCMKGESWGHNAVAYAFLTSSLFSGRVFGRVIYKTRSTFRLGVTKNNLNAAFLILAGLFIGVAVVTRYSVLVVLYFAIGFTASRVGASQDDGHSKISGRIQTYHTSSSARELDTELHAKMKILTFMFSTIFSSLLYNKTSDALVTFPAFYTSSIFSTVMVAIFMLNVFSDRSVLQRIFGYLPCRKVVIPKSRQVGMWEHEICV